MKKESYNLLLAKMDIHTRFQKLLNDVSLGKELSKHDKLLFESDLSWANYYQKEMNRIKKALEDLS